MGTSLIEVNIQPGLAEQLLLNNSLLQYLALDPQQLTEVNGTLYFRTADEVYGGELWKSDGTFPGTVMVTDIYPGLSGSDLADFTEVNGRFYFSVDSGNQG